MFYLHVQLQFQGLEHNPSQDFSISCDSVQKRRNWRREFDSLIGQLNEELDLGWMTCISPEYNNFDQEVEYAGAQHWTPEEAIEWVREWYQDSLTRTSKK